MRRRAAVLPPPGQAGRGGGRQIIEPVAGPTVQPRGTRMPGVAGDGRYELVYTSAPGRPARRGFWGRIRDTVREHVADPVKGWVGNPVDDARAFWGEVVRIWDTADPELYECRRAWEYWVSLGRPSAEELLARFGHEGGPSPEGRKAGKRVAEFLSEVRTYEEWATWRDIARKVRADTEVAKRRWATRTVAGAIGLPGGLDQVQENLRLVDENPWLLFDPNLWGPNAEQVLTDMQRAAKDPRGIQWGEFSAGVTPIVLDQVLASAVGGGAGTAVRGLAALAKASRWAPYVVGAEARLGPIGARALEGAITEGAGGALVAAATTGDLDQIKREAVIGTITGCLGGVLEGTPEARRLRERLDHYHEVGGDYLNTYRWSLDEGLWEMELDMATGKPAPTSRMIAERSMTQRQRFVWDELRRQEEEMEKALFEVYSVSAELARQYAPLEAPLDVTQY